jgi:hypothetical protein
VLDQKSGSLDFKQIFNLNKIETSKRIAIDSDKNLKGLYNFEKKKRKNCLY